MQQPQQRRDATESGEGLRQHGAQDPRFRRHRLADRDKFRLDLDQPVLVAGDFLSRMAFRSDFWRSVAPSHGGGVRYPVSHKRLGDTTMLRQGGDGLRGDGRLVLCLGNDKDKRFAGVFHLFVVQTPQRDALQAYLAEHGIGSDVHYPFPAHLQAPYVEYGDGRGSLPSTEQLASEVLSLPIYPELSDDDVDYVCQTLRTYGA